MHAYVCAQHLGARGLAVPLPCCELRQSVRPC